MSSEPDDRAGPSSKRPLFDEAFEAKQVIVKIPNLLAELFCSYSRFFIMRALQHLKKKVLYILLYMLYSLSVAFWRKRQVDLQFWLNIKNTGNSQTQRGDT